MSGRILKAGISTRSNRLLRTRLQTRSSSKAQFIKASDSEDDERRDPPLRSKRPRTVKAEATEYFASLRKKASRGNNPEVFRDDHCVASTSAMDSHPVSKKVTKGLLTFLRLKEEFIISSFVQDSRMLSVQLLKSRCLPLMRTQNMMMRSQFWKS